MKRQRLDSDEREMEKKHDVRRRPRFAEPMKCLPVDSIPKGKEWLYELKFDGYRALADCREGEVILLSRNKNDLTPRYPAIASALGELPIRDALLDGEIVALDRDNRPSFQALQHYREGQPLAYYLFDLIYLDGQDWRGHPLTARRARLKELLRDTGSPIFFSSELLGPVQRIWTEICKQCLEGLVAKRRDSLYESGKRSGQWVKIKAVARQEFVIGGYTEPKGGRSHFGALLVGTFEEGRLQFCGRVGTGFNERVLSLLRERMDKLRTTESPFFNLKTVKAGRLFGGLTASELKGCVWITPELVCEVQFSEWTEDGVLRHPSFLGLREDKPAAEAHRELPGSSPRANLIRPNIRGSE